MGKSVLLLGLGLLGIAACAVKERGDSPAPQATPAAAAAEDRGSRAMAPAPQALPAEVDGVSGSKVASDGMAYDLGRSLGEQTGRSAWKSVSPAGSCDDVEKLAEVIHRSSGRIVESAGRSGNQDMLDYSEGYVHGLRAALAGVAVDCSSRCSVLCKAASDVAATVFCQVQKALGADVVLRRMGDAPAILCPEAPEGCGMGPASVRPGDCP